MKRNIAALIGLVALSTLTTANLARGHEHEGDHDADEGENAEAVTVTGEVIDMACYIDHGATGAGHADCAKTCIDSGLPVGLKSQDGKIYLLIGEHKPMNNVLAEHAAKTITVQGKLASRDGINLIENAEIVTSTGAVQHYTCPMHHDVDTTAPGKCPKCGMSLEPKK